MPKAIRDPLRLYACTWCGQRKFIGEMRHPGSGKGKPPSTCAACRDAHPDQSWCDFHGEAHPVSRFKLYGDGRPGYFNICRDAVSFKASRARGHDRITCVSCGVARESWFFRGGRAKSLACRRCEDERPEDRWCLGCDGWLSKSAFTLTGAGNRFPAARCRPCRVAHEHGTTVAEILRIQGSVRPECAACGSTAELKVDHDHKCCPTANSGGCCIRGYLCHECNSAEGLLKTAARARKLARYMTRWESGTTRPVVPLPRPGEQHPSTAATPSLHPVQRILW